MNDSKTQAANGSFPTFRRLFGWLFTWRMIRRYLFALACLVTLLAFYYAEENWRGRRAWNKYRQELEARGELLDLRAFIPQPVPDEQNFAATPFVRSWFEKGKPGEQWHTKDNYSRANSMVKTPKYHAEYVDLVAWESALAAVRSGNPGSKKIFESNKLDPESRAKAAPSVLEGLKDDEAYLAELRAASRRPYSRYPVVYDLENPWGILIPHVVDIKLACQRLELRACAELAAGRSESALEDVKLMLYLTDSVKTEPFLVTYLVRLSCFGIATQPIWEGLAGRRWSEAQLQELQARLEQYNLLADLKRPLAAEQAAGVLTVDLLALKKYRPGDLSGDSNPGGGNVIGMIVPRGWFYQEQLNYCRLYQNQLGGTFDAATKRVSPKQVAARAHELEGEISGGRLGKGLKAILRHQVIASMLLPALGKASLKAAKAQTTADQAALACALERYRLANGQFPDRLDALVPRFMNKLPNDVISGEPLKYRRTNDGQFVLYSVGWNEKDDAGVVGKLKDSRDEAADVTQGDWVWQFPEK